MVAFAENEILTGGSRYNADAETQNYYVRNRYYLPTLGRWLTRDPIGYQGGINLYEYVRSSPVGNVDGEGLRRISFAFDAFINGNRRGHWLHQPGTGIPALKYIGDPNRQVMTDWRGFGQFNARGGPGGDGNARLYSYGWIDSCDIGHLRAGDYSARSGDGLSESRLASNHRSVETGRAQPRSYFSHLNWSHWNLTGMMPGPTWDSVPYKVMDVSASESRVLFSVYASFPLSPSAPSIEYKIAFDFKRANPTSVNVTLSGERTPFPDFEGYINGQLVYHAESPSQGPGFGNLGALSSWVNIPPTGLGVQG